MFEPVKYLWPPDTKSQLTGKDPDAGCERLKAGGEGMTEEEMVGWHHRLNAHEFEQTPQDSERQGSLVCCSPRGHKESDTTERLNNTNHAQRGDHVKTKEKATHRPMRATSGETKPA